MSKRDVFDVLCPYGQPRRIDLSSDGDSADVWFANVKEGSAAIEGLRGTQLRCHQIRSEFQIS